MKERRERPQTAADGIPFEKPIRSTDEQLQDILKVWKLKGKRWPHGMPPDCFDAAVWWIGRQESRKYWEKQTKTPIPVKHGEPEKYRIVDNYADRVVTNLRKFLHLPNDQQRFIIAAWEDGLFWRGEDTETPMPQFDGRTLFENILHERERMIQIGVTSYREEVRKKARSIIRTMTK